MHTYSTDNDSRPKIYGIIALISYFTTILIGGFITFIFQSLALSIAIGPPSWGLAFAAILTIYERKLWNTRLARKIGATRIPDLNGRWEGWILTSYDGNIPDETLHPEDDPEADWRKLTASLDIDQTWRKMSIHFETETSSSDSNGATLLADNGKWPSINYQYRNDPPPDAIMGMEMHHGTGDLEYKNDSEVLEGVYYTGPQRENHGKMMFKRADATSTIPQTERDTQADDNRS
jgi:hypothetical protein